MWCVSDIEFSPVEFDFSSSGQSRWSGRQARCKGLQLVNAVGLVEWDEEPVQVRVCEQCGMTRCAAGESVHVRRAGEFVVVMPAFSAMLEGGAEAGFSG